MNKPYTLAALGGTFDRLHDGHKHFITTALQQAESLVVGVTVSSMNTTKTYTNLIEDYDIRSQHLHSYLSSFDKPFRLVPLKDTFGETLTNQHIDALAITSYTREGARIVNQRRSESGLLPLPIIEATMLTTTTGDVLSSSLIRSGLIDRSGYAYADLFAHDFFLREEQKEFLRLPQGKLFSSEREIDPHRLHQASTIATVGDIVTQSFFQANLRVDFGVVDFCSKKKAHAWQPKDYWTHATRNITNPAGRIMKQAAIHIFNQVGLGPSLFIVTGEEDLLAIPLVLCLPLGSLLYYGQPGSGIVELEISENLKQKFLTFL